MTTRADATLLITGGAGFIGSNLIRECLANTAYSIVNLDKLTYAGSKHNLDEVMDDPRHTFVEGDILDSQLTTSLLERYRPQAVVHLAAESHVDRSIDRPPLFATTNALGTCTLLDRATHYWQTLTDVDRDEFRFLLVSTDEVFGSATAEEKFDEESRMAPNSPYAASKAAGENFARAFSQTYGLPIVTANPSNNYGPRQHPEKFIPKMILNAAKLKPLPVYGDGLHERDWVHVDDCCRALLEILNLANYRERYVIGSNNCVSNRQVAEKICDLVSETLADGSDRRKLIIEAADRPGHDRRYAVDADLLRSETDWQPTISFEEGLSDTVRWYLDHPEWVAGATERAVP